MLCIRQETIRPRGGIGLLSFANQQVTWLEHSFSAEKVQDTRAPVHSTWLRVMTSGVHRSWPKSVPTETCGSSTGYNYIVQHNPTPHGFKTGKGAAYESELRDKRFGRVYRLIYNGKDAQDNSAADKLVANGIAKADNSTLVNVLANPNLLWR